MNSQGPQQHSITEAAADWAVRLHAGALTDQEQDNLRVASELIRTTTLGTPACRTQLADLVDA